MVEQVISYDSYSLLKYRKDAITAAKDLGYGNDIVERIKQAENETQIDNIMRSARRAKFND